METSISLIKKLNKCLVEDLDINKMKEVEKEILDMPELEGFRVLIWLCVGPKPEMYRALMEHLGRNDQLYGKFAKWCCARDYDSTTGKSKPGNGPYAYEANGFKRHWDFVTSTRDLVSCVV